MRLFLLLWLFTTSAFAQLNPSEAQYSWNGNLLTNPSFEQGRTGWSINCSGVSYSTTVYTHLTRSIMIDCINETLLMEQSITIPLGAVGKDIYYSLDISPNVSGIEVCSVSGGVEIECVGADEVGFWQSKKLKFTTDNQLVTFRIKSQAPINGSFLVDNAVLSFNGSGGGGGGGGGGDLPNGGLTGAALVKASSLDLDTEWDDLRLSGFSSRFNQFIESEGLRDTLLKILDFQYQAPLVTLSGSSNTLREKGAVVSSITLSASVTKRSDDIARIRFLQGATEIADFNPPSNTGTGTTTTPYSVPFSDNITFSVQVTDTGSTGGPSTATSNTTYSFVYPYYYGAGAPSLSASAVAGLTKDIINSNANLTRNFTTSAGQVYYFAYPASYGALTSILDENNFEVFGSWTLRTENITGLDGTPVSYRIYEFNNPVTAGTTNFTFKR